MFLDSSALSKLLGAIRTVVILYLQMNGLEVTIPLSPLVFQSVTHVAKLRREYRLFGPEGLS